MSAVKTSPAPLDPSAFAARFSTAARAAGFCEERFGARDGCPLVAYTRRAPGRHPRIYLSAGIHGDEPAGPLALLELLTTGAFDHRATWFLVPLLNPTGFTLRTRENAEAIDLNRDYRHPPHHRDRRPRCLAPPPTAFRPHALPPRGLGSHRVLPL